MSSDGEDIDEEVLPLLTGIPEDRQIEEGHLYIQDQDLESEEGLPYLHPEEITSRHTIKVIKLSFDAYLLGTVKSMGSPTQKIVYVLSIYCSI